MHPTIQPRQRTEYRKPRRLNVVSITLLLLALAAAYYVYFTWPVYIVRLRAKNELAEVLPRLWRANLTNNAQELLDLRKDLVLRLRKVGVKDPKMKVGVVRGQKVVALEAHFAIAIHYPWIDVVHVYELAPRAETDAARVEW